MPVLSRLEVVSNSFVSEACFSNDRLEMTAGNSFVIDACSQQAGGSEQQFFE